MARPLRIELSGGLYHVTSRGDRREDIFFSDADRETWLVLFAQVCKRSNWVCHAYCLMSNHYHLVIETPEANLADGMRQLNGVYTQLLNRTHRRVGHVFQGRYKAIIVERDSYLLELARYVVLNPVRARMVDDVAKWPWTSYPAMIGATRAPPWLQTNWLLAQFSRRRDRARIGYQNFVREGLGLPSIWDDLQGQIYLGGDAFVAQMKSSIPPEQALDEIPRAQRRASAKPLAQYRQEYANDAHQGIALAYATGDYSMKSIAEIFGVHYTTVSRIVKAHEARSRA